LESIGFHTRNFKEDMEKKWTVHTMGNVPVTVILVVRNEYFARKDIFLGLLDSYFNNIRYTWSYRDSFYKSDQIEWDFKLGLGGRYEIMDQIDFFDFEIIGIPYESLPKWVMSKEWDIASFIAVEQGRYFSSEGIYDWGVLDPILTAEWDTLALRKYLAGEIDLDIEDIFVSHDIHPTVRAELAPLLMTKPVLYISAIDQRLHLEGAKIGVKDFV